MTTTIDESWIPTITNQYMRLLVPVQSAKVYDEEYRNRIYASVSFSLKDFTGKTATDLGTHLLTDMSLREAISNVGDFTEDEWPVEGSPELNTVFGDRLVDFMKGVTFNTGVSNVTLAGGSEDIEGFLGQPLPQESASEEEDPNISRPEDDAEGWQESLRSYQHKLAEMNERVILPEFLKEPYVLKQLIDKGWIVPLNAKEEEMERPDAAAIAELRMAQDEDLTQEEAESELEAFEISSRDMADRGEAGDVTSVFILTDKGARDLPKMLRTLFDDETIGDLNLSDTSYENLVAMMDLVKSNAPADARPQAIFAWTGDDTIDTQNDWRQIDVDDKIYINQNDLQRLADYTNFSILDLEQIAKASYKMNRGIAAKDIPWQIIALAIEQNQDYLTDDGTPITLNMMDADRKFSEYLTNYNTAINTYVDSNGDAFAELAYLHLLAPDLAMKVYRGDHDQLTMGEVNFLNEAFNVIDTFHQNTAQFSPGWGTIMETKDWLTNLPPGKMSKEYLTEAQIESIIASGDIDAIVAAGTYAAQGEFGSQEEADLAEIDETRKAVTEQMYRDMYELWFLDAPTDQELAKFMGFWASGEADYRRLTASWSPYSSDEFSNPNAGLTPEQQQARTGMAIQESLRADPQYQRMYGHKPVGMSESSYAQVFTTQATQDYGTAGTLNTGLRKRAMEAGDPGVITREGIITGEGYDNSRYMGKIMNLRNAFRRNT